MSSSTASAWGLSRAPLPAVVPAAPGEPSVSSVIEQAPEPLSVAQASVGWLALPRAAWKVTTGFRGPLAMEKLPAPQAASKAACMFARRVAASLSQVIAAVVVGLQARGRQVAEGEGATVGEAVEMDFLRPLADGVPSLPAAMPALHSEATVQISNFLAAASPTSPVPPLLHDVGAPGTDEVAVRVKALDAVVVGVGDVDRPGGDAAVAARVDGDIGRAQLTAEPVWLLPSSAPK